MKPNKLVLWVVALAVTGGLIWGGSTLLKRRNAADEETTVTSYTVAAERGNLVASITPTGEVYAPRSAELTVDVTRLPLIELDVVPGERVVQGQVVARIDPSSLERAVDQARANLLTAEDALEVAKAPHTSLDRQRAELDVAQAETAVAEAKESLYNLQNPDMDAAREAVEDTARDLAQAQEELAALKGGTSAQQEQIELLEWLYNEAVAAHGLLVEKNDTSEAGQDRLLVAYNAMMDASDNLEAAKVQAQLSLLAAENEVRSAEDTLADAREALADLQAGVTPLETAQANDRVAQAEYSLAKAQATRDEMAGGPDENAIKAAQASYDAAVAALVDAQATLEAAVVVAPFDGTVVSVGAEVGDLISAGVVIATLADLTELRVMATIDETEISQVQVGQDVAITFDAFAGYNFQGQVLEVPLEGTLSQSVVTYAVPVSLDGPEGVDVKSGMTANLTIVTGESQNALLIPALAVQQGDSGNVVVVQNADGTEAETPVEVGLGNGTYVEVLRGLNEGDQVVVTYDTSEDDSMFGFGPGFAIEIRGDAPPGGGPPGAGTMP